MKLPKDDSQYKWTSHIKNKMVYYRISPQMIKNILKFPTRKEKGIAPNTLAVMKRNDTPKRKEEIWVMYQLASQTQIDADQNADKRRKNISGDPLSNLRKSVKRKLISAWRYPGISKPGKRIPIPEEILEEIKKEWF